MSTPPEVWIDRGTVEGVTGWSVRWIEKQSACGKIAFRESDKKGANGKPLREFLLSTLPPDAQIKFAQRAATAPVTAIIPAAETLPLFPPAADSLAAPARDAARSTLPPEWEAEADACFRAIEPMLNWSKGSSLRMRDGRVISNIDDLAAYIAAQQEPPMSGRTIRRWYDDFKAKGYTALARKPRSDKGRSRFFVEHPETDAYAQHKFLKEGIGNMRLVHEAICRERPGLSRGEQPPDYETVRAFLNSLPRPLVTLAHEGAEKYHSKHSPFMQRGPQPVMAWWIGDHRVHDVMKRNTLFAHLKDGQAFRLWLTAIYDWGSHKIVGYCFAPTPSSDTINSALRMALSQYGFPERFYWDNGKDFKKVRANLKEMRLTGRAEYLLQHQNVEFGVTSALPKHPRSKPIEAYFTRIARRFDPIWRPAYLGNRPENCPADCRQAQKQHEEYLRGKRDKSPLPTDAEFILAAVQWIEEYNGTRLDALDGQTPNEVFDAALPEARRQPIERRALDALLGDPIPRTVLAGGCVEIERVRYEPVDSLSLGPLSLQQGRKIHVLRDPYNLAEAVAVDPETHEFIGELRPQGFVDQDPNSQVTRDMIRAEMRKQRSLKRAYADWLGMLGAVASARGWKTERHALMERAGLRTGTDNLPALPAGAAPGAREARQLAPAPRIKPGSTFISDAVAEDAALFANIEQGGPHVPDSPFVDDAAARCIAAMKEEDT